MFIFYKNTFNFSEICNYNIYVLKSIGWLWLMLSVIFFTLGVKLVNNNRKCPSSVTFKSFLDFPNKI